MIFYNQTLCMQYHIIQWRATSKTSGSCNSKRRTGAMHWTQMTLLFFVSCCFFSNRLTCHTEPPIWTIVGAFVFIATSCWDGDFCHSYSASSYYYYYYYYYYLLLFRPCLKCSSMVATKVKGTVTKLRKTSISKDCLNK